MGDLTQNVRAAGRSPSNRRSGHLQYRRADDARRSDHVRPHHPPRHDQYTHNHSVNVSLLSIALGNRAGYPKVELADLGLAALFHDMGKSSIAIDVLNKPGERRKTNGR
ncbi:MAG: hypothetical protein U0231_12680 [Nitrospiraceae bacterium]